MDETNHFICVIGSSAGGINALKKLFTSFSSFPPNVAFIVAQHLSPGTESHLAKILSAGISMLVVTAANYDVIHPGRIYIAPPDKNILIVNGKIILKPANTIYKPNIDNLFVSAAAAYGQNLIGVILTGSGKDGAKGIAEIKKHGGYTIVQLPADAEYDSMPLEAIRTHTVDAIAECQQIPALVVAYANNKNLHKVLKDSDKAQTPLKHIFNVLLRYSGTDFSAYKPLTIERRMELRSAQVHCNNIDEYRVYMDKNPQEIGILYQHLLIGVTSFFRDKEAFAMLHKKLAELLAEKKEGSHVRMWSAACSTGEEAYTLAIMLHEILGDKINSYNIKVYASDVDEKALAVARKGVYTAAQVKYISQNILQKYFTKTGENYAVNKAVRLLVVFHKHDITGNPPFVQVELITCRNMLIYFNQQAQSRIISSFHYALRDDGLLFLGKSEAIPKYKDLFLPISTKYRLYKKMVTISNKHHLLKNRSPNLVIRDTPAEQNSLTDLLKDGFYKAYPHAFVVINDKNDVQHIQGDIARFISLPQGTVTLNIVKMVRKELQIELRALLHNSAKQNKPAYGHAKHLVLEKEETYMRLVVWPLASAEGQAAFFVVAFEVPDLSEYLHLLGTPKQMPAKNARIIELEKELEQTKEQLQAFIDQLEAANAQQQLLNEELHTTNEELQVANEELEANNEEQQEANTQIAEAYSKLQELHSVLEQKENALQLTTNSFQTVLDNAKQGYLLVGKNYTLVTFNHQADAFFRKINKTPLVAGESMFRFLPLGSITQFKQRFDGAWAGLTTSYQVKHIIDGEPLWENARYAPVYGIGTAIENVLLSFADVTKEVIAQQKIDASELLFRSMTENSTDIIFRKDAEGRILYISSSIRRIAGYNQQQVLNRYLFEFLHKEDVPAIAAVHKTVLLSPGESVRQSFRLKHANGSILWMEGMAVNMLEVTGVESIIVNIRDVTARKLAEKELVTSELRFRSLIENSHDGIALFGTEGTMTYLSSAIKKIMGYTPEELTGVDPRTLSHPDDVAPVMEIIGGLAPRFGETATAEYRMKHKNGEWRWIKANITNQLQEEHVCAFVFNYEDITERRNAEGLLRQSERMMADAQKIAHFGSWELDITEEGFGGLLWSDEVFRIYGYEPNSIEVSLEKASAPIHPDDGPMIDSIYAKAFAERSNYSFDHRIIRPDGTIRWVHEDAHFITDEATDRLLKIAGTIQDITEQKESENKMLNYEANLKTIFDNTEIAYTMLNEHSNIVTFNPKATKWVQAVYNKALMVGDPFLSYIGDRVEAGRLKLLLKKVLEGKDIKFDFHSVLPDGSEMWYIARINPIKGPNGYVHGICIAISDITQRKQHEIEREKITTDLIQRNKDLEQFTFVVSHNLRAPLTNIIGLSQLLIEDSPPEVLKEGYPNQLLISAQKMDVIIKDLNNILQLKKEVREFKQTVYFSELVQDIKQSIQLIILQQDITLVTDFAALNQLSTIKSYLYSVFYNLITNSIKYRQPGIPLLIEIKSTVNSNKLDLAFSDNGLGIDLKRKGKEVFGLYKRFHYHVDGKGMGLFMVKTQVETLGGSITVESEINKGTKFTVSFPLV